MRIYVKVIPRSAQNKVYPVKSSLLRGVRPSGQFNGVKIFEGEYKVRLTAPPVDNQANNMLLRVMAEYMNIPKSSLTIIGGKTARLRSGRLASAKHLSATALRKTESWVKWGQPKYFATRTDERSTAS